MNAYNLLNECKLPTVRDILQAIKPRKGHDVRVYLHANRDKLAPVYGRECATFTLTAAHQRTGSAELKTTLDIPGRVRAYKAEWPTDRGFWSLFGSQNRLTDLLAVLPPTAMVSLEVALDAYTTESALESAIHIDTLSVIVHSKGTQRRYLLDVAAGPSNTARFGQ